MSDLPQKRCKVYECTSKGYKRNSGEYFPMGLCSRHYARLRIHGDINKTQTIVDGHTKHPLYRRYSRMLERCNNKNHPFYHRYGGRGIKVCERWSGKHGFTNWLKDMGEPKDYKLSVDRINNDGDYEPSNCRWATQKEQVNNSTNVKRIAYKGIERTCIEWSRLLGGSAGLVSNRINTYGWDTVRAITTLPTNKRGAGL